MNNLRIIYMGTPEFAVPGLETLIKNKYTIVAVVTAPDKPRGRGQVVSFSPVKEYALQHNIPVLQPSNLKAESFLKELKEYNANLQIVVAFRMLPEVVWNMPAFGTFNLHASLLPYYRGAAPINWAIINGEKETGVTTFFLQHEIDTGHIIFQEKESILPEDNAETLYQRLQVLGATLILKTVRAIEQGTCSPKPQSILDKPVHAPKIFKETCEINWNQPYEQVINFVRGLNPYPAAWTTIEGRVFKIFKLSPVNHKAEKQPGQLETDHKSFLYFRTTNSWVSVETLQQEGKKKMTIEEFLRGNRLPIFS